MGHTELPPGKETERIESFNALVTLNEQEISGTWFASYSQSTAELYLQKPAKGQSQLDISRGSTGYPVRHLWQKSPDQVHVAIGTKEHGAELWTLQLAQPQMMPRKPVEKIQPADWKKPLPGTGIATRIWKLLRIKRGQPQERGSENVR